MTETNQEPIQDAKSHEPVRNQRRNQKISPRKSQQAIAMRSAGISLPLIAAATGFTPSGIWRHLKRVTPDNFEYHELKNNLAEQYVITTLDNLNLSTKMTKHLVNISEETLAKMNPVNIAAIKRTADVGAGIAHEHYRLEANLSTQNIAYDPVQAREELAQLRQLLSDAEVKVSDMGIHMGVCDNEPGK